MRGKVASLGSDCIEKPMTEATARRSRSCWSAPASISIRTEFRRYGSARKLYNFHIDHAGSY